MNRRLFCQSLAMTLAKLGSSPHSSSPPGSMQTASGHAGPDRLAQVLGLEGAETAWLNDLSTREHGALLAALTSGAAPTPATISLIYKVIGRRERLFKYVGYPPLPNRLTACDGLIRE